MSKLPLDTPLDYLRAVPLKLVIVLIALSFFLRNPDGVAEFYPFSYYPMYSKFDGNDYFLYIADHEGKPLPSKNYGITTPKIKKRFKKRLREAADRLEMKKSQITGEHLEQVGIETLRTLRHNRGVSELKELQLMRVSLNKQGSTIKKSAPEKIASMRIDEGVAP